MFQAKQDDLIMALRERERVQIPSLGSFCIEDLMWTDQVESGKEKYKTSILAIIF